MSGFELNKIAASILFASLVAMMVGFIANILYKPNLQPEKRGFSVEVTETTAPNAVSAPEVKIDIAELMQKANADAGKEIAKKCQVCHSLAKGEPNKIGPNLWNIVGSKKADIPGYKFSNAMINKGGTWDEDSLFNFLHKPSAYIPGTKMSFIGLNKPEEIADVILFLKTLHD